MNNGLTGLKNLIWAIAIIVALVALLVGLVFSVSIKNYSDRQSGTMSLGEGGGISLGSGSVDNTDIIGVSESAGSLIPLSGTQDNGLGYVYGLTYLCDNTILALNDYSATVGSSAVAEIWTDNGSGLIPSIAADTEIVYPNDGSLITPSTAAMISKPARLVIYMGGDGLVASTMDGFIAGYEELIAQLRKASSETQIICCSIGSVTPSYSGGDGLTKELIAEANEWIKRVCADTGVYYADLADLLNTDDGYLDEQYAYGDGRTLNNEGIAQLVDYFRYHGI